ncbi:hypothetical protein FQN50_010024 [Emmonsiellopsis sp. PD_5]|nr:hypothetical protein FQN50_010024 [Emmonsiellopsis sp. PD_5]
MKRRDWIPEQLIEKPVPFRDGTEWSVLEKISEKEFVDQDGRDRSDGITLIETQATYHALQTKGPSLGKEGILKIRMQVPPPGTEYWEPEQRRHLAVLEPGFISQQEILSLQFLNKRKCSVTPELYAYDLDYQRPSMPVPGGYVVYVLMEKVPGESLREFWDRPREERRKIRVAFKEALSELYHHDVVPWDHRLDNIHYDEKNNKCYILDYEQSAIVFEDDDREKWDDYEWRRWGLGEDRDDDMLFLTSDMF